MSLPDLCVSIKQYVLDSRKFVYKQQIYVDLYIIVYIRVYICILYILVYIYRNIYVCLGCSFKMHIYVYVFHLCFCFCLWYRDFNTVIRMSRYPT